MVGATASNSASVMLPVPSVPGTMGTPAACTVSLATILSPMAAIAEGLGPMKTRPASTQSAAKDFALGQESVAGMDRVCPAAPGDVDDLVAAQIGLARRRGPEQIGFIGVADVQSAAVRL